MAQKKQLSINIGQDSKLQLQGERESEIQENQPRTYQDKTPLSPCQPATGTSPDSPFSYSSLKKKMTMDLKQEYDSEELLFQLEDELMVLENIKRKLEKSIQKNDKIQQDICIAEYCSIVERVVQSIKILSQRKQNISEKYELNIEQDEKLETLSCQFNIFYTEYQKTWSQQLKENFHNFISMAKPLRLDSLQESEDMD